MSPKHSVITRQRANSLLSCYSDGSTPAQAFTYTLTGKPAGVTDAAGTRGYTYNEFDELVSESLTVNGVTHAKAPDGCKGDWTTAQLLPRRGEGAMGCARVNRKTAQEDAEEATNYDANKAGDGVSPISRTEGAPGGRGSVRRDRGTLNQYTAIGDFAPQFDADGNQTRVQTSTGIWTVSYNAENRPIVFTRTNDDGTTTKVSCAYDHMGRRATKKVETISADNNSTTTLHQRYLYRNYLQIACCDLTRTNHPHLWFLAWDPTQPVATRPLALRKDGTWYCYGWDLTKNICEVFSNEGTINNTVTYSYTPYGAVMAEGTVQQSPRGLGGGLDNSEAVAPQGRTANGVAMSQPIQWSSEFYDDELGLVYYNYRHYNPMVGRWLRRDMMEADGYNSYSYVRNRSIDMWDAYGLFLDFLKNSKGNLPTSTYEVSIPIRLWGGYPFGSVEIGPPKNGKQEITMALGINWNLSALLKTLKPAKLAKNVIEKLPRLEVAVYTEETGSYFCGCFDFCNINIGGALTFGNGRRGGNSSNNKDMHGLDTRYAAVMGGSIELKGNFDLCKGSYMVTLTVVLTMGFSTPGFSIFGYGVNPSFDVNMTEEWEILEDHAPQLAVLSPCAS